LLTRVGVGNMHLRIAWEPKQIHKVTQVASVALSQPSIQPTLQRGSYSQESAPWRSTGSLNSQFTTRPAASTTLILARPTESSVPLALVTTPSPGHQLQESKVGRGGEKRQHGLLTWDEFAVMHGCNLHTEPSVSQSLKPYTECAKMNSQEIRRWLNDSDSSVQGFLIHNQKVSVFHSKVRKRSSFQRRAEEIESDLQALVAQVELPNVDFFASLRDGECVSFASCKPIFLQAKQINNVCREGIFMPPRSAKGFVSEAGRFSKAGRFSRHDRAGGVLREQNTMQVPFGNKLDKAFFRGSTTGAYYTPQNWRMMQRSKVVQVSLHSPGLLDARFTKVHGGSQRSEVEREMRAAGVLPGSSRQSG